MPVCQYCYIGILLYNVAFYIFSYFEVLLPEVLFANLIRIIAFPMPTEYSTQCVSSVSLLITFFITLGFLSLHEYLRVEDLFSFVNIMFSLC